MALIHQNLYKEDNVSGLNMREYITLLADKIFESYSIHAEKVQMK